MSDQPSGHPRAIRHVTWNSIANPRLATVSRRLQGRCRSVNTPLHTQWLSTLPISRKGRASVSVVCHIQESRS